MIDFLFGIALGVVGTLLFNHFKGESPAKVTADFNSFKQELKMLSDAFNQAAARLEQNVEAKINAADTGAEVDAEATAAVAALADKFAPARPEG